MKTSTSKIEDFHDNFLREVVVNYVPKSSERFPFNNPEQVANFARGVLIDNSREHFIAIYLNARYVVVGYSLLAIGTVNMVSIHPREVYHRALLAGAFAFVVVHNHPSNELDPSTEDRTMTEVLQKGSRILGLHFLDHVIISDMSFYSFRDSQPSIFQG